MKKYEYFGHAKYRAPYCAVCGGDIPYNASRCPLCGNALDEINYQTSDVSFELGVPRRSRREHMEYD